MSPNTFTFQLCFDKKKALPIISFHKEMWSEFPSQIIVNIDVKIVDLKYKLCMCSVEVCGAEQVLINRVLSCMRDGDYF